MGHLIVMYLIFYYSYLNFFTFLQNLSLVCNFYLRYMFSLKIIIFNFRYFYLILLFETKWLFIILHG
jgi:hypothetical protein